MAKEMLMKNKDDIVKLYVNGLTQQQIADQYNTSKSSIARFLRSVGITSKVVITEFDEHKIIELYKSGMIINDIANKFNIGDRRVSDILKKYNIQILQSYERQRKYSLNERYFDCIATEEGGLVGICDSRNVVVACTEQKYIGFPFGDIKVKCTKTELDFDKTDKYTLFSQQNDGKVLGIIKQSLSAFKSVNREFDDEEVAFMYAESFSDKGIGQAIMNRMLKAAGHKIMKVDKE